MASAYEIKAHDRRPLFVVVLKDNFGLPTEAIVDLTNATGAVFNMRDSTSLAVKVNRGSAAITNAAGGEVTYSWGTADTDTAGDYQAEIEIAWNDGKAETFPSGPAGGLYWDVLITGDIA